MFCLIVECLSALTLCLLSLSLTGKTVKGKLRQFARSMRHKDVRRCGIGGFGFYQLFRFHHSREMDDEFRPDFTKNKDWFDIKILTDGTQNNKKMLRKKAYTDDIKKVLKELKIVTSHYGHWGRVNAPVELEFAELSPDLIRILGKLFVLFV